jgi:hypothetical protein
VQLGVEALWQRRDANRTQRSVDPIRSSFLSFLARSGASSTIAAAAAAAAAAANLSPRVGLRSLAIECALSTRSPSYLLSRIPSLEAPVRSKFV